MKNEITKDVLAYMQLHLDTKLYNIAFKDFNITSVDGSNVYIKVNGIFSKTQIEKKEDVRNTLLNALKTTGINSPIIHVSDESTPRDSSAYYKTQEVRPVVKSSSIHPTKDSGSPLESNGLNPKFTFDNFIVGSSNDLAFNASKAVAENPGKIYNPLFIYGNPGLGKTHLIQAVGNEIVERRPKQRVLYARSEEFLNSYTDSIRSKKTNAFIEKFRNVDVLIIDDIQIISGKTGTQEQFFHAFNDLYQQDKQIIISCDQHPSTLPDLTDRLRSRFTQGMTADIQMPEFETRCAIASIKAEQANLSLGRDVIEAVANAIRSNVREIEGIINKLSLHINMMNADPSVELVNSLVTEGRPRPERLTPKKIIERVARYYQMDSKDILGKSRSKDIAMARHVSIFLIYEELQLPWQKVAQAVGRQDHTTAMHGHDKITKMINESLSTREQINEIKDKIYA